MKDHENASKHHDDDHGNYAPEVHERNRNTYEETAHRNSDAIYNTHGNHDEPEAHGPEEAKAKREEREREDKEREEMLKTMKDADHKEEGYGPEVREKNKDVYGDIVDRNR